MPESKRVVSEEVWPLRRLLPAVARPPPAERYSRPRVASRQAVTAACDICRKQKAKVNGFRMPQDLQMESSLIRIGSALERGNMRSLCQTANGLPLWHQARRDQLASPQTKLRGPTRSYGSSRADHRTPKESA